MKKYILLLALGLLSCVPYYYWNTLFERNSIIGTTRGWTGGDSARAVVLPGDRILWVFGDSFVTGIDSSNKRIINNILVDTVFSNTIAIQDISQAPDPTKIHFYARNTDGSIADITSGVVGSRKAFFGTNELGIPPSAPGVHLLWPHAATGINLHEPNPYFIMATKEVHGCDPSTDPDPRCLPLCLAPAILDGSCSGGMVADRHIFTKVSGIEGPPETWTIESIVTPNEGEYTWGMSVVPYWDRLFIYGMQERRENGFMVDVVVAFAFPEDIMDPTKWYVLGNNGWVQGLGNTTPQVVARNVGQVFSINKVTRNGISSFLLVHDNFIWDHYIYIRPSPYPSLWSDIDENTYKINLLDIDQTLHDSAVAYANAGLCPPDNLHLCSSSYHGQAYPEFSVYDTLGLKELLLGYIISTPPPDKSNSAAYYKPKFTSVLLDDLEPWKSQ